MSDLLAYLDAHPGVMFVACFIGAWVVLGLMTGLAIVNHTPPPRLTGPRARLYLVKPGDLYPRDRMLQ